MVQADISFILAELTNLGVTVTMIIFQVSGDSLKSNVQYIHPANYMFATRDSAVPFFYIQNFTIIKYNHLSIILLGQSNIWLVLLLRKQNSTSTGASYFRRQEH